MPETFLILLAGGIMLAAAVSDPWAVTLRWLRLAGVLALAMTGVSGYFLFRRDAVARGPEILAVTCTILAVLGQLGFVQVAWRRTQRAFAGAAFVAAVVLGSMFVYQMKPAHPALLLVACALTAAVSGLALMDMLLGHAYLTAAEMTMAPFLRLNRALAVALAARGLLSVGTLVIQSLRPVEMFWTLYLVYVATRWLVGLLVPGVFVYMADDCIRRRATQSATGILYVAGVLVFIGEIIGLYLLSQTGMPL